MKTIIAIVLSLASIGASAQVHVNGYTKANGTYVAPHERTAPDATLQNNYSTKGNVNPYTGKEGTVSPQPTPNSFQPQPQQAQQPAPAYQPQTQQSGYQQPSVQPLKKW
jgi:hypothetical protein